MFERLANLFRRKQEVQNEQASILRPIPTDASNATEAGQVAAGAEDALRRFMCMVTAHLDVPEGRRLINAVLTAFDCYDDAATAFEDGVLGDEGQQRGHWLVIQCDWKAHEELEWQVAEVASSVGIQGHWHWSSQEQTTRTVPGGLCEVANWLKPMGFELLNVDLGHDAYYALIVRSDDADDACQAADGAGLDVCRYAEFAETNVN